jgi:hypothetical protein
MLSSQQDPKDLPNWLRLDYYRDPRPLGRWRTRLARVSWVVAAFLGAALLLLPVAGPRRWRSVFQSAPVATGHAAFNDDCGRCHTEALQTAGRLWHGDDFRSVKDAACVLCHDGPPHQASQTQTPACATCHEEHQGRTELARVADSHCTACHADLKTREGPAAAERRHVTAFADNHPECRLWRGAPPEDRAQLRFNHKVHLLLNGEDRKRALPALAAWLPLECGSCHKPDAAGRAMQPISYQAHCRNCHPIAAPLQGEWTDPAVRQAAEQFRATPAPHPGRQQTAVVVRDALRGRYLDFARTPGVSSTPGDNERRLIPGTRRGEPMSEQALEWTNRQLREAERVLFDHGGGCALCHVERSRREQRANGLPDYQPTRIPDRWFDDFSRFSHRSHPLLSCVACHPGAPESERTADVLIPKLETCRTCHSPQGGARHDCAACHLYHDPKKGRGLNGPLKIDELHLK